MNICADIFSVCTTQPGLNTLVTIVCLACYNSGTIRNLENPKLNCRILPILEDTVPPTLPMMK